MNKIIFILLIFSGIANGILFYILFSSVRVSQDYSDGRQKYPFLAKRIFTENQNDVIIDFTDLRKELREYVALQEGTIGLYFEYLPTGVSIGIRDREAFRRASLIKIPIVMRIYKLIELKKLAKSDLLTLDDSHLDRGYGELWKKGAGWQLTVDDAIKLSLHNSDNTAANVLKDKINEISGNERGTESEILSLYDYLDIPKEPEELGLDISPKGFASILKSLYFSAFLSNDYSSEILSILGNRNKSYNFLSNPIPPGIIVANKFGVNGQGTERSLVTSDCGIIYVPKRQYILCVMIDDSPEKAGNHIKNISQKVYSFIVQINIGK